MKLSYFLNSVDESKLRYEVFYNPQTKNLRVKVAKDIDKNYNFRLKCLGNNDWKFWIDADSKSQAEKIGIYIIELCYDVNLRYRISES